MSAFVLNVPMHTVRVPTPTGEVRPVELPNLGLEGRVVTHDPGDGSVFFIAYLPGGRAILMDEIDVPGPGTRFACHATWSTAIDDLEELSPIPWRAALKVPSFLAKVRGLGHREIKDGNGETIAIDLRYRIAGHSPDIFADEGVDRG